MPVNPYTEKRKAANKKWDRANLDQFTVMLPKGYKDRVRAVAAEKGETLNALFRRLVDAELSAQ